MFSKLIDLLHHNGVPYRLIEHEPEGRTEIISQIRGNQLSQAAKCIILMIKLGKKVTRYVLCVVPGDARVDLAAIKSLYGATYVSFASPEIAEKLSGSVVGTVLPFSFSPDLDLIVDPALFSNDEIYFNAARLDCSMVMKASDYLTVAKPRIEKIGSVEERTD